MKAMKAMTKVQLHEALRAAGVMFRTKAPKAELEKLFTEQANGQATKAKSAKGNGPPKGAKAMLRGKFERAGVVTVGQIDKIAEQLSVSRSTVLTAMSDLKNPKYAGKAGALNIERDGDVYRLQ